MSKHEQKRAITLGWGDFVSITVIVGLGIGGLATWISSIDNRVSSIQTSVENIKVAIAENSLRLEGIKNDIQELRDFGVIRHPPPPTVSTLWLALRPDDLPYSKFDITTANWEGVWPDFAKNIGTELKFDSVQFISPADISPSALYELNYSAVIVDTKDVLAAALAEQGWSGQPLDPYFEAAGYGPFNFSIFLSPRIIDANYKSAFLRAIEEIPTDRWADWGEIIEKGRP